MEACDDIAYSILDIEDGIKKELASPSHLMVYLHRRSRDTQVKEWVDVLQEQYEEDMQWLSDREVSGKHAEDVLSQLLRSYLVALAVSVAVPSLKDEIESGKRRVRNACLEESKCKALLSLLKEYSKEYIYTHRSVVRIELEGHRVIPYLLQVFWDAVAAREEGRANKPQEYVISRISPNYFRSYLAARKEYPEWYARLQLVCDMVCGMTDSYAMSIADEFRCLDVGTV